jgi:hypothetical protein
MAIVEGAPVVVGPLRDLVAAFNSLDRKARYQALLDHAEKAGAPSTRDDMDEGLAALSMSDAFDDGALAHYASDWLGEGGSSWFGGAAVADILYEGLLQAARIGLEKDLPLNAIWVPAAGDGRSTASTVESPSSVTLVVVTPPPTGGATTGSDPEVHTVA